MGCDANYKRESYKDSPKYPVISVPKGKRYNISTCPCGHFEMSHQLIVSDVNTLIVTCEDCDRFTKCVG